MAQSSKMARQYFVAFKNKNTRPITSYFLSPTQQLSLHSWPESPRALEQLDSMQRLYQDSLVQSWHQLDSALKKEGFSLKHSTLLRSEQRKGVQGQLTLVLSHRKKIKPIFLDVLFLGEQGYLVYSFPSLTPSVTPSDTIVVPLKQPRALTLEEKKLLTMNDRDTYSLVTQKHSKTVAASFLEVQKQRQEIDRFIDSLRTALVQQSGGYIEQYGRQVPKGKKDKETPNRLFVVEGNGQQLQQKILTFEKELFLLIEDKETRVRLQQELGSIIDLKGPKEQEITWATYTFSRMPVAAVFPILRKLQNDMTTATAVVTATLLSKE